MNNPTPGEKPYSLRIRLLSLISAPVILASIIIGVISLAFVYHEIDEVYDAELSHAAKVLYQLTEHEVEEHEEYKIELGNEPQGISHQYEKNIVFSVWDGDRLVTRSPGAAVFGSFHPPAGFSNQALGGIKWRFFAYVDAKNNIIIQAAEKIDIRTELTFQILGSLFFPALFFLPIIFILIWFGATWGLQPVITLSRAVDQRDAADLTPINPDNIPREIMPVVKALNRLLGRVGLSLKQEREFTDNAAHELRTPLAAMKTQIQVLIRQGNFASQDREGLENLLASLNRGVHMVDQLLSFARLQNQAPVLTDVDLSLLTGQCAADLGLLAKEKNQTVTAAIDGGIHLHGHEQALAILIRNLLENAIKFTPQGGKIGLGLSRQGDSVVLSVDDSGPGISDKHKPMVFDRFYRIDKSKKQGSGLGLAMVKWIADIHRAEISLGDNHPHGMHITICFPTASRVR